MPREEIERNTTFHKERIVFDHRASETIRGVHP